MDFHKEMRQRVAEIEQGLQTFYPEETGYQNTIWKAMNYSLLAGGKRLRPLFMHEIYVMFGGQDEKAIRPFMAAIEMIHTYSLVHDDLPAMDDDDLRRGRATTHKVYGEAMGILAGDALLNYAFETAMKAFDSIDTEATCIAKALRVLAEKAGPSGMVGGQVVDVEMNGKNLTQDVLQFIYEKKTSALLEASMMVGAILAGATDQEVMKIESMANYVGIAFQIQDDILDIEGDEQEIGKPVHSDEDNDKQTYVVKVGMEQAKKDVSRYSEEAEIIVRGFDKDTEFLEELIRSLIHRIK